MTSPPTVKPNGRTNVLAWIPIIIALVSVAAWAGSNSSKVERLEVDVSDMQKLLPEMQKSQTRIEVKLDMLLEERKP